MGFVGRGAGVVELLQGSQPSRDMGLGDRVCQFFGNSRMCVMASLLTNCNTGNARATHASLKRALVATNLRADVLPKDGL